MSCWAFDVGVILNPALYKASDSLYQLKIQLFLFRQAFVCRPIWTSSEHIPPGQPDAGLGFSCQD